LALPSFPTRRSSDLAAPGFEPCFLRSEIGAELDRFVTGPKAARRAEIGNAAFGRDAGAGKDDRAPGGLDHSGKLVYVITHRQSRSEEHTSELQSLTN